MRHIILKKIHLLLLLGTGFIFSLVFPESPAFFSPRFLSLYFFYFLATGCYFYSAIRHGGKMEILIASVASLLAIALVPFVKYCFR